MKHIHLSTLLQSIFRRLCTLGVVTCIDDPEIPEPDAPGAGDGNPEPGDGDPDGAGEGAGDLNPDGSAKQPAEKSPEDLARALKKMERRIHNRTKALGAKDQELASLRQQLAALQTRGGDAADEPDDDGEPATPPKGKGAPKPKLVTLEDAQRIGTQFAQDQMYRAEIATKTTAMLKAGATLNPNFRASVLELAEDLPIMNAQSQKPTPFMEAVLDCGPLAAEVMAHIVGNDELREELSEIQDNPRALARRMALVEIEVKKKPRSRSSAATPLEPVRGGGSSSKSEDSMSDAEWMEHRRTSTQRKKA